MECLARLRHVPAVEGGRAAGVAAADVLICMVQVAGKEEGPAEDDDKGKEGHASSVSILEDGHRLGLARGLFACLEHPHRRQDKKGKDAKDAKKVSE